MNAAKKKRSRQAPIRQGPGPDFYRQTAYQPASRPGRAIPYVETRHEPIEQRIRDIPDPRTAPDPRIAPDPAAAQASLFPGIVEPSGGLTNLADGVSTGAARGTGTRAGYRTGENAVAVGANTEASGAAAFAEGLFTSTNGLPGAHIMGRYGVADEAYSWFLANGTDELHPGTAAKILQDGSAYADLAWNGGGADYAGLFETETGQPIEPGYFVTFAGGSDKIRLAQNYDTYILGVTSGTPGFVAGAGELRWKNKYKTDKWGRIEYEDVQVPDVKDKDGRVLIPAHVESRPVLNPLYDPAQPYVPRDSRPEWVKVALLGAVLVRDDGTLTAGGFCLPGVNGIATAAHSGYRVLKRTDTDQALILFR